MSSIYVEFKPTFLYIKRNRIAGKLYFGKIIWIKYKNIQYRCSTIIFYHNPELGSNIQSHQNVVKRRRFPFLSIPIQPHIALSPDFLGQGVESCLIGAQRRVLIPDDDIALAEGHVGRFVEVQLLGVNSCRWAFVIRPAQRGQAQAGQQRAQESRRVAHKVVRTLTHPVIPSKVKGCAARQPRPVLDNAVQDRGALHQAAWNMEAAFPFAAFEWEQHFAAPVEVAIPFAILWIREVRPSVVVNAPVPL